MVRPTQKVAIGTPTLPHPAAKRLVQSTFLIGFAMRKVLSIKLPSLSKYQYIQQIGRNRLHTTD